MEKEHLVTMERFLWHGRIQTMTSWQRSQGKNTIRVSVQLIYNVGDQQEAIVYCFCRSLVTVKDM